MSDEINTENNTDVKKRKPLFIKQKTNVEASPIPAGVQVENSSNTLVNSLSSQLSKIDFLNAKFLPLQSILLDPNNPRELSLDIEDVISGPRITIDENFDDDKQDELKEILKRHFGEEENKKQKIQDFLSIALLASTIRTPERLMQPICVYEKGNKYMVLAGERRTLAHHVLGAKHIAANIISEPSEQEKALLQYIENSSREDLSLKDKYKAIRKIVTLHGQTISVRSLASILRISKSQAQKYARICKEDNVFFKKAIENGMLTSPEDAYNIIKSGDSTLITAICNHLLKGKGIEEALLEINAKSTIKDTIPVKRITPSGAQENHEKKEEKLVLKGDDLTLLKELIGLAIKTGKLKITDSELQGCNDDISSLWSKTKAIMTKVG